VTEYQASDRAQQVNLLGDNTGHISVSTRYEPIPRPVVSHALRRDVATFVGRSRELQRILDAAAPGRVVTIHTVDGMAGVGKTALVTRAAHELVELFPDGRYFVELHAHTPGQSPADPADVLAGLLIELGMDPGSIPETLVARRDLWRDRLAGQRVLLVLDDARDDAQIEPLLPAGRGCLTLITSRRRLIALDDAWPLALDTLDPEPAAELFITLARRETVTDLDREAAAEIARLCGFLPLASVLLAGRLAHHPSWSFTRLALDFSAATDRLEELKAGTRAVSAAFMMSYQDLPSERQALFRSLGLHPGLDTDAYAAAALAGVPVPIARRELDALYVDHLVDEINPGRYRLHDLLREYARLLAASDPIHKNDQAIERLLNCYQTSAAAADKYLSLHPRTHHVPEKSTALQTVIMPDFDSRNEAVSWMRTERANMLACLEYATAHQPARVSQFTAVLAGLLDQDGPWPLAKILHQRAAAIAKTVNDQFGEANALDNLAIAHMRTGNSAEASALYLEALAIYRMIGDRLGEANTLNGLGHQMSFTLMPGQERRDTRLDLRGAADLHHQALVIFREVGSALGEASALEGLGFVYRDTEPAKAASFYQRALDIFRRIGNRRGEADAMDDLGILCWRNGDYVEAAELHQQALTAYRETGDRRGEADALNNMANVRWRCGLYAEAAEILRQAIAIYSEIGNRYGKSEALNNLGIVRRHEGDLAAAADLHHQALAICIDTGDGRRRANVLNNLGSVAWRAADPSEASNLLQEVLTINRNIGSVRGEAEVLNETGYFLVHSGRPLEALSTFIAAHRLARRIQSQIEQATALEGAARCWAALGDINAAVTRLTEAVQIYLRLGVPEANPAESYLATLTRTAT
jgi:tetratricopeptide (TPR) repeat protein